MVFGDLSAVSLEEAVSVVVGVGSCVVLGEVSVGVVGVVEVV